MTEEFRVGQEVEWNEEYFAEYYAAKGEDYRIRIAQCIFMYGSPMTVRKFDVNVVRQKRIYVNDSDNGIAFCWFRAVKPKAGFSLGELE